MTKIETLLKRKVFRRVVNKQGLRASLDSFRISELLVTLILEQACALAKINKKKTITYSDLLEAMKKIDLGKVMMLKQ